MPSKSDVCSFKRTTVGPTFRSFWSPYFWLLSFASYRIVRCCLHQRISADNSTVIHSMAHGLHRFSFSTIPSSRKIFGVLPFQLQTNGPDVSKRTLKAAHWKSPFWSSASAVHSTHRHQNRRSSPRVNPNRLVQTGVNKLEKHLGLQARERFPFHPFQLHF